MKKTAAIALVVLILLSTMLTVSAAVATPSAPTGLKAAASSLTSAKLTWNKVSGADGYQIYRSASKTGTYSKTSTIKSGSTVSYVNSGLSAGSTYYYKIRAYVKSGTKTVYGSFSSPASVKLIPAASASFQAEKYSDSSILLAWKKVSDANGYQIYRSMSKTGTYSKIAVIKDGAIVNYLNSGLAAGNTYFYKIRAYATVGSKTVYGSFSKPVSVTITDQVSADPGIIKGDKGDPGEKGEKGDKGDPGADGRGIAGMTVADGEIIVTYTDGTTQNLGKITTPAPTSEQYLKFTILSDTEVSVGINENYKDSIEEVIIPSSYNGRAVTQIEEYAFLNCKWLKTVYIPASITFIDNSFPGTRLQNAYFEDPSNWTYGIGESMYYEERGTVPSEVFADPAAAAELLTETLSGDGAILSYSFKHTTS